MNYLIKIHTHYNNLNFKINEIKHQLFKMLKC
jgi:hypothetical protein